ncbi:MAG: DUF1761 domain-containing protein [Bacteroidota bacterium]|nr:DUF1761 domain-containing protein [Bacteroidota bacterium]
MNLGILLVAALIPLIVGFVWYNPIAFGKAWMRSAEVSAEKLKTGNMLVIFLLTYVLSFLIAAILQSIVIHQTHMMSILLTEPGIKDPQTEIGMLYSNFMAKFGHNYRTFRHGALHGTIAALFLVMPVLAINAMYERKKFKYIAINSGYWIVSLAIMGGVICKYISLD